jgi:hypothetical protein
MRYTPPKVQRWKELRWVLLLVGGSPRGLVRSFGNQKMVLNECVVADCIGPADPELDKRKPDPLVAFLDDAGLAENDFIRDEVMREAVSLI